VDVIAFPARPKRPIGTHLLRQVRTHCPHDSAESKNEKSTTWVDQVVFFIGDVSVDELVGLWVGSFVGHRQSHTNQPTNKRTNRGTQRTSTHHELCQLS
jgi:hypothetical protein